MQHFFEAIFHSFGVELFYFFVGRHFFELKSQRFGLDAAANRGGDHTEPDNGDAGAVWAVAGQPRHLPARPRGVRGGRRVMVSSFNRVVHNRSRF